jgi:multiple sugar transport system substrate-binding protein
MSDQGKEHWQMGEAVNGMTRRGMVVRGAAAAPLALATACGQGSGPESSQPVGAAGEIVWSHYFQPADPRAVALGETMRLAEKATGVRITELAEPGAEYWPKRQAEQAAGTPNVDIMINQSNWVIAGGLSGMFVDHYDYMRRDKVDLKQYYQAELESWAWRGKLWAITYQVVGEMVYYNKKLFDAKGVKYPHKDWTYDDLVETSRRLNDPSNNRFALSITSNNPRQMLGTFITNFGGKLFNASADRALYGDDANALRGAEFDADLLLRHRFAPTAEATRAVPAGRQPMEMELVAMEVNGAHRHIAYRDALGAENLDFAPPPKGPTGIQSAVLWGNSWSIMAQGKGRDAAWRVLKWTHTREGMLGPYLGVVSWPPLIWAANSPQWMDRFKGTRILDVTRIWETRGRGMPVFPEGGDVYTAMDGPINRALSGQTGIRDAMRESANATNEVFARRPAAWR